MDEKLKLTESLLESKVLNDPQWSILTRGGKKVGLDNGSKLVLFCLGLKQVAPKGFLSKFYLLIND